MNPKSTPPSSPEYSVHLTFFLPDYKLGRARGGGGLHEPRAGELLGPLHNQSDVDAYDARADTWGFGGLALAPSLRRRQARRRAAERCGLNKHQTVASGRRALAEPNTSSNACRSAISTSAMVTGWPRSTRRVTP